MSPFDFETEASFGSVVEPLSVAELADSECMQQQRGARKARRDDIARAFFSAQKRTGVQLHVHDFAAFRGAWLAAYRLWAFEPTNDPETFFNKVIACGCAECAAQRAA